MDKETLHEAKQLDWKIEQCQERIEALKKPQCYIIGLIEIGKEVQPLLELEELPDAIKNDVLERISSFYEFELCELQDKFGKLKGE